MPASRPPAINEMILRPALSAIFIGSAQHPAAMPKTHYAGAIVPVDLIGGIRGHDIVSAGKFLEAKAVLGDFIDCEGKSGIKERHLLWVWQIHDMLLLPDFAKEDAFPAVDPCRDSAPVQLSLCLVTNLPFVLMANQHWPAKRLPDCGLNVG
ncbi:hypothetical protein [Agrobacterium sp. LAD9]|uniref:hypothetical protein n=1 Tax=Agrobacterium sp. LAD9 TaxID=2055153 RepID=UPI0012905036|nr:hypothetical protein [Agrobacterium sp. LAD9]